MSRTADTAALKSNATSLRFLPELWNRLSLDWAVGLVEGHCGILFLRRCKSSRAGNAKI